MKKNSGKSRASVNQEKSVSPAGKWMRRGFFGAGVLILAVGAGSIAFILTKNQGRGQEQTTIRPNAGRAVSDTVTEEGSVSVGTVSQTFALDLSEYEGNTGFSWGNGGAGGMNFNIVPGGGAGGSLSGAASSSGARQLVVEEVYVKVGEEVKAGDPILKVTEGTLEDIRQGFAEDVTDAKEVYDQMVTKQKQTENEAAAELKENQLYSAYADTEYNLAVEDLEEAVDEIMDSMTQLQETIAEDQKTLVSLQESLEEQKTVLESADYVVENEDRKTNTYSWLTAMNAKVDMETTIENLESEIESLQDSISEQENTLTSLNEQLIAAQKALKTGMIEAESKRLGRQLAGSSAQEIYDVATQLAEYNAENAKEDYEDALGKLAELDTYIVDQVICAAQDGVITAVSVSAGDTLQRDTELIALNSYDDVTITLTLDEDDMDAASLGSRAEVVFSAFPDEVFEGEVAKIGDAQIDSNTNMTTYQVVVSILENGSRLYEGMSAEVTFTRQKTGTAPDGEEPEDMTPEGEKPEEAMPNGAMPNEAMKEGREHETE